MTGIAGPGGGATEQKPVQLVYIVVNGHDGTETPKHILLLIKSKSMASGRVTRRASERSAVYGPWKVIGSPSGKSL
jgi:nicotinamide mononucleotide (NMN) deamidase PncC